MKKRILIPGIIAAVTILIVVWLAAADLPNWKLDRAARMTMDHPGEAISPTDLPDKNWLPIDARSWEEYQISHLPGAIFVGDSVIDYNQLYHIPEDQPLLVYCSVGARSEATTDSLRMMGFQDVTNMFGGIFAWAEADMPIVNKHGQPTDSIHGYSAFWAAMSNMENVIQ